MDCHLFWEAVKSQNHQKHKLALAAVQNIRNRNLSEPSDQTTKHIDVYADYLSAISPQFSSRALRALLKRGGSKSNRRDNRYTEVMLNIDDINI